MTQTRAFFNFNFNVFLMFANARGRFLRLVRRQLAGHVPYVTFRGTTSSTAHRTKHVIMSFCDKNRRIILKPVVGHAPESGTS